MSTTTIDALGIRPAPAPGTLVAYHGTGGGPCRLWTVTGPCGCDRCAVAARLLITGPPMVLACAEGGTERLLHVRPAMVTVADPAAPGYREPWQPPHVRLAEPQPGGLTLGDREELHGRSLRQQDKPGDPWYCVDCLADLPTDPYEHYGHRCGDPEPAAPAPVVPVVEHKTRTTQPSGYLYADSYGTRRSDKRGRVMFDKSSWALCTCGWVGAGATREEARSTARAHREANQNT